MKKTLLSLFSLISLVALPAGAVPVGYYDMSTGQGEAYMVPPITAVGQTPVQMFTLSPAELATVRVLFVTNPNNCPYGAEWVTQLPAVQAAVNNGMALVVFDRCVTNANLNVPGMAGVTTVRDFTDDANLDPVPGNTVVNGPAGVIGATTLDGGDSSSHGYALAATLPAGTVRMLTQTDPTHVAMYGYPLGAGFVIYSTVPLDCYLTSGCVDPPRTAMNTILGPNTIFTAVARLASLVVPAMTPAGYVGLALLLLAAGAYALRRRRAV